MDEAAWLACEHPAAMLIYLRGEVSPEEREVRRSLLSTGAGELHNGPGPFVPAKRFIRFVAACAARLRQFPLDAPARLYLDAFQRYAQGQATFEEVYACGQAMHTAKVDGERCVEEYLVLDPCDTPLGAGMACWKLQGAIAWMVARESIAVSCASATEEDWFAWGFCGGPPDPLYQATQTAEARAQADLLREVIGNPFRSVRIDPAWLTQDVLALAGAAYEDVLSYNHLDPDRLLVLADALLDAGCDDSELLGHLRREGPHWRGCWAVDAILGEVLSFDQHLHAQTKENGRCTSC